MPRSQPNILAPFYQVCWMGLVFVGSNLLLAIFNLSVRFGIIPAALFACLLLGAGVMLQRRQIARERALVDTRLDAAYAAERPRSKARLQELRTLLKTSAGDDSAHIVRVPGSAIVMSTTVGTNLQPIVEIEAGFWATYSNDSSIMQAAIAHEAGHVAARDIPTFQWLLALMRSMLYILPVAGLVLLAVVLSRHDLSPVLWGGLILAIVVIAGLAVVFGVSALIVARELQADAFAVEVLGTRRPVDALLGHQSCQREAQPRGGGWVESMWVWFIQPDLRWRSRLPVLDGHFGPRVEMKLGLAVAGFIMTTIMLAAFVSRVLDSSWYVFASLTVATLVWASWIAYHFIWGCNHATGGRHFRVLWQGLASTLRFTLSGLTLAMSCMFGLASVEDQAPPEGFDSWVDVILVVTVAVVSVNLFAWAVAKLVLLSSKERERSQPSILRMILAFSVLLAIGFVLRVLASPLLGHEEHSVWRGLVAMVVTALLVGTLAHRLTPPAAAQF